MTVNTHCKPTGSLGTSELPIPNISAATVGATVPATGLRRGVVVFLHGLSNTPPPIPNQLVDNTFGLLPSYWGTIANILAADGWVCIQPPCLEDAFAGNIPSLGISNDIANDTGLGSRQLTNTLHWWDHIVAYVKNHYGNWPIVVFGFSYGGWRAYQIAANRTSTLTAYCIGHPVTIPSNIAQLFTTGSNLNTVNSSGADVTGTQLNSVTIPGMITYGTTDQAVGYGGTSTIASGSTGGDITTIASWSKPSAGVLDVASSTGYVVGSLVKVTGLTGGVGYAEIAFTGTATGQLTGCTLVNGSGTTATGNPAVQSQTAAIVAAQQAAQPSNQVVANITAYNHAIYPSMSGQQLTGTPTATALSSMGTLTVATTSTIAGSSGNMAIYASDNLWHTVTFTGSTGTTFTGCTYSGTQSATVINGSPICLSGNGTSEPMSYPYWFSTVVDPLCPKTY